MPHHHNRAAPPSIISSSSTRRSPRRQSDSYGRTSGGSLVSGHGRTSGGSFFTTSEYPHSHTHHTHHTHHTRSRSGSPVYGTSPSHIQTKPTLMDHLAHGPATRPAPQHQQSFGADTTAATCEGPTSHVPPSQRGFAAPPPQPVVHRTQHVPTIGDRFHGAAKKVAGTVLLDRNKRAEKRAMELGIPVQYGQPVVGHTAVSSMTTSSGRPRSGVRYHF